MTLTAERSSKTAKAPKAPRPAKAPKAPKPPRAKGPRGKAPAGAAQPEAPKVAVWPSPVKPSLMLLPAKIAGRRAHQHAVKRAWVLAGAMLGLAGVLYIPVAATTAAAERDLEAATQESQDHRDYLASHADVQNYYDGLILRKQAVAESMVKDVSYAGVFKAVNDANRSGATLTQLAVRPGKSKTTTGEPFSSSRAVGYIDVTGSAPSVLSVAQFVSGLLANKEMLTDAYVTESAVTKAGTQFKLTVGYTEKAMSFKGEAFRPKPEELAAVAAAAADAAAAAAEAADEQSATETTEDSK